MNINKLVQAVLAAWQNRPDSRYSHFGKFLADVVGKVVAARARGAVYAVHRLDLAAFFGKINRYHSIRHLISSPPFIYRDIRRHPKPQSLHFISAKPQPPQSAISHRREATASAKRRISSTRSQRRHKTPYLIKANAKSAKATCYLGASASKTAQNPHIILSIFSFIVKGCGVLLAKK